MYAKCITKVNPSINIETQCGNGEGGCTRAIRSRRVGCNNRLAVSRCSTHRARPRSKLPVMSTSEWSALLHEQEAGLNATAMASVTLHFTSIQSVLTPLPHSIILSSPDSNYNAGINSGILARVLIAELALNVKRITNARCLHRDCRFFWNT